MIFAPFFFRFSSIQGTYKSTQRSRCSERVGTEMRDLRGIGVRCLGVWEVAPMSWEPKWTPPMPRFPQEIRP